jgi:hypothetical protein
MDETREYIRHRIGRAGGDPAVFRADTYEMAHEGSQGIPRLLNVLCDTALVYAYAAKRCAVDTDTFAEVFKDRERQNSKVVSNGARRPLPLERERSPEKVTLELDAATLRELFAGLRDP